MAEETDPPALRVDELVKQYGGLVAVDHVSFDVVAETITGIIGPNGAGKSTTFDCITGVQKPDAGAVYFGGEDITGRPPHAIAQRGVVRTFQIARELGGMTVLENLMLAPKNQAGEQLWRSVLPGTRGSVRQEERALRERVWETLDFFDIDHLAEETADSLSGGQRKLLELARALLTDPDVLLLDEPMAGVNPTLERRLLGRIHELTERGYTFILVEHDIDMIAENCDRIIVLDQGRVIAEGIASTVFADKRVEEAYLGK